MSEQSDHFKVLENLLKETQNAPDKKYDFEKIKMLVEKSSEMRKRQQDHAKKTEEYFQVLKEKIAESGAFLERKRKDLENINCAISESKPKGIENDEEFRALMEKSDEEIEAEISDVKAQLALLESRVKEFTKNTQGAEEFYNKNMKTLTNFNLANK